jgi:multicomponent K+:H+ antiporter subunit D
VSAVFAILTKVGVYSVLRIWLLLFGDSAGASAGFGGEWLVVGGMATLAFGAIGVLASHEMRRLASFSLIVSSGTLLAAIGAGQMAVTGAALYYLVASTLGVSAFFLVIELVERGQAPGAALLAVSAEYFGDPEDEVEPEEEVGFAIPATTALLGVSFACCALVIAGLPPFPGFIAKFALVRAVLVPEPIPVAAWALLALLITSGFAAIISIGRAGVQTFWAPEARSVPRVRLIEMAPIVLLLILGAGLVVYAAPAMQYLEATAEDLHTPQGYIQDVLRTR